MKIPPSMKMMRSKLQSHPLSLTFFVVILGAIGIMVVAQVNNTYDASIKAEIIPGIVAQGSENVTEDIKLPISLDNKDNISGFQFDLSHPSFVEASADSSGLLKVFGISREGITPGKGPIINLIFEVSPEAAVGSYQLGISNTLLGDANATPISADSQAGIIVMLANEEDLEEFKEKYKEEQEEIEDDDDDETEDEKEEVAKKALDNEFDDRKSDLDAKYDQDKNDLDSKYNEDKEALIESYEAEKETLEGDALAALDEQHDQDKKDLDEQYDLDKKALDEQYDLDKKTLDEQYAN